MTLLLTLCVYLTMTSFSLNLLHDFNPLHFFSCDCWGRCCNNHQGFIRGCRGFLSYWSFTRWCEELVYNLVQYEFVWSCRNCNCVAHLLAKQAEVIGSFIWNHPPEFLYSALLADSSILCNEVICYIYIKSTYAQQEFISYKNYIPCGNFYK